MSDIKWGGVLSGYCGLLSFLKFYFLKGCCYGGLDAVRVYLVGGVGL